jgi:hypothetical protein
MKTQKSISKALSSFAMMTTLAIAIAIPAATTASAQSGPMKEAKSADLKPGAQPTFDLASLAGSYGWNSVAFVNSSTSQPASGAGLMIFDGHGEIHGYYSGNYLGTPIQQTYKGTYLVNADGGGRLEFTQNNGAVLTFDLFIVSGGNEIFLVNTQPGILQTVDVKKQ